MEERLIIDVARLASEGESIEGELDCAVLDMDGEEFIHPFAGLRYSLEVQLFGSELLVRGSLEQDFDAVCSRCGCDFDFTVKVPDFTYSVDVGEKTEFVDLTDELRQSIILTLPAYPVCRRDCLGVCQKCGKNLNEGPCNCKAEPLGGSWSALDAIKLP